MSRQTTTKSTESILLSAMHLLSFFVQSLEPANTHTHTHKIEKDSGFSNYDLFGFGSSEVDLMTRISKAQGVSTQGEDTVDPKGKAGEVKQIGRPCGERRVQQCVLQLWVSFLISSEAVVCVVVHPIVMRGAEGEQTTEEGHRAIEPTRGEGGAMHGFVKGHEDSTHRCREQHECDESSREKPGSGRERTCCGGSIRTDEGESEVFPQLSQTSQIAERARCERIHLREREELLKCCLGLRRRGLFVRFGWSLH